MKTHALVALVLGVSLSVAAAAPLPAATPQSAESHGAHQRLLALFAASDEGNLKRNPLQALVRNDLRYADQFGDYISDAYFAAEKAAAMHELAALAKIDRSALSPADQVSYDVFKYQRTTDLKGFEPEILDVTKVRPIDHFSGLQTFMPDLSSGEGAAPFKTLADYDNNLKRLGGFVVFLQRSIDRMKQGLASGVTNPKLTMALSADQFDALIKEGVESSEFYKPISKFPESISAPDRKRLAAAYAACIREQLIPAFTRERDFIRNDYLPRARDSVGLGQMPGGEALYRYLVASITTTDMTPDAIHALGLSEVDRIHAEMDKARAAAGFRGSREEFAAFLRSDARFAPKSAEDMHHAFVAIEAKILAAVPKDFSLVPKSNLEIKPVPAYKEKTEAAGSYEEGAPDGSRPGVFYYDTYDLASRYTWGFETLFLHEGIPGHHFQISLAQENTQLPAFQRFGGNTAYVEGWALYAESLGAELGMYTDPYQLFGHLNDEILRAMRLVVDTGIHAQGWSRDAAIAYMLDNSAMGRTDATAEVERYIALPAQALAYKVGQLTIRRLRNGAELDLGKSFDVREFHAQVLDSGALPMAVLEKKINDWVAVKKSDATRSGATRSGATR
jgi:uncharacterized protein (DUF885 family)